MFHKFHLFCFMFINSHQIMLAPIHLLINHLLFKTNTTTKVYVEVIIRMVSISFLPSHFDHCSKVFSSISSPAATLHKRLGHPSSYVFHHIAKTCGFSISHKDCSSFCSHCCVSKSHKRPFVLTNTNPTFLLP